MNEPASKPRRWPLVLLLLAAVTVGVVHTFVCVPTWLMYGVSVSQCPAGDLRPTLRARADGLRRGVQSTVTVQVVANYTTGPSDEVRTAGMTRFEVPKVELFDKQGTKLPLALDPKRTRRVGTAYELGIGLGADLADGDYLLRVSTESALGPVSEDLKVALYAPAKVSVLTDRPLYEPGNTILFRSVVLRARDLVPLDGRPGKFVVSDPTGEVVLEEIAPAKVWGVAASSFPLDESAPSGQWTIAWESADARGETTVTVEPFTLPRFRVELGAGRPFYSPGETPKAFGKVVYASGAPVPGASIDLTWSSSGDWPMPTEWLEGGLPKQATTDETGRFELSLPIVPGDLRGEAPLSVRMEAKDSTGDRVEGAGRLLLAQDRIAVSAVTELESGVVEGFNNRVFLRATTPAGAQLAGVELLVQRAWEPTDKGITAVTDEDGVALLQLDPGPPVNVVVPPMPIRLPPKPPAVRRSGSVDLLTGEEARLDDQTQLDAFVPESYACARFLESGSAGAELAVKVEPNGRMSFVGHVEAPLERCLADVLRTRKLNTGADRLLKVSYEVEAPDTPRLQIESMDGEPDAPPISEEVSRQLMDARSCLPEDLDAGRWPRILAWTVLPDLSRVTLSWMDDPRSGGLNVSPGVLSCVESRLRDVELQEPSRVAGLGVIRVQAIASGRRAILKPRATTRLGYELQVTATAKDARGRPEVIGKTKVFIDPGHIPPVRLRATPVLAEPGSKVEVEILRGPGFSGQMPKKLLLSSTLGESVEAEVDPATRRVTFELPSGAKGWWSTQFQNARALVFVRGGRDLEITVKTDRDRYSPGDDVRFAIQVRANGRGTASAVGLFGVDASLEQLAPLTTAEVWDGVRTLPTSTKVFDSLDAAALALGRVQGANAAAATVLRVMAMPGIPDVDSWTSAEAEGHFDPVETLTDRFYTVLGELHAVVREWERTAPEKELMHPKTVASLWEKAIERVAARGEKPVDAYGQRLRISQLPPDLMSLLDPRAIVIKGTRLPEDVENFAEWVGRNEP